MVLMVWFCGFDFVVLLYLQLVGCFGCLLVLGCFRYFRFSGGFNKLCLYGLWFCGLFEFWSGYGGLCWVVGLYVVLLDFVVLGSCVFACAVLWGVVAWVCLTLLLECLWWLDFGACGLFGIGCFVVCS